MPLKLGETIICGEMPYPSMPVASGWRTIVCTKPPEHQDRHNRKRVKTEHPLRHPDIKPDAS
jgi:hypothetical protein